MPTLSASDLKILITDRHGNDVILTACFIEHSFDSQFYRLQFKDEHGRVTGFFTDWFISGTVRRITRAFGGRFPLPLKGLYSLEGLREAAPGILEVQVRPYNGR